MKLRAEYDAILVGAETIRKDNPFLNAEGAHPITKVTLSASGNLEAHYNFFSSGEGAKLVYTNAVIAKSLQEELGDRAVIVSLPVLSEPPTSPPLAALLRDLSQRGIQRLMVEGGSMIISQFLRENLVDEIRLAIAGTLIAEPLAPRFLSDMHVPLQGMKLHSLKALGETAVLVYKFSEPRIL